MPEGGTIQPMRKAASLFTAALLLVAFAAVTPASAAPPPGQHCPDGGTKTESGASANDLVLDEGTLFCVKAGSAAQGDEAHTGILTADGETTLREYLFLAGIVDGTGEAGRDVSYYVVYPPAPTPTPTPPDDEEPTPTPTPPPDDEEPTPTPTPPGDDEPTPTLTAPPTDTAPTTGGSNGSSVPLLAAVLLAIASGAWFTTELARRKR